MENLRIDDFWNYKLLSGLRFSPTGKYAAFVVRQPNDQNGYNAWIWLYNSENGQIRRLTALGQEGSFAWNGEETLIFPSARSEAAKAKAASGAPVTVFNEINVTGGEAMEAFCVPLYVGAIHRLNKTEYLVSGYFDAARPDLYSLSQKELSAQIAEISEDADYEVLDELPYRFNGSGFMNKKRTGLFVFSTADGSVRRITPKLFETVALKVSPSKRYVAYAGAEVREIAPSKVGVYLYDHKTGESRQLVGPIYDVEQLDFYDGKLLMVASEKARYGVSENPCFYTVDLETGRTELLMEYDNCVGRPVNSDCRLGGGYTLAVHDKDIYFTSTVGYETPIYRISADRKLHRVTDGRCCADFFDLADDKLIFGGFVGMRLQELYFVPVKGGIETRLTGFNEGIYTGKKLSKPEHLTFVDKDGYEVDGWVMRPVGYRPEKRYPAVLSIHGGPRTAFGEVFHHEMQYLAGSGYFVLYCNPRGSEGKGNEFAEIRGAYGSYDYDEIMQFVDVCLERYPEIDPERLGIEGGSYGGYMTNWVIGHTNRFAAAVSQRSISNFVTLGYASDIGYTFVADQVGVSVWDGMEKLWEQSPLKYAPQVKTPTLFLHSDEDYRCTITEGYQMFTALKLHGVETKMVVFHGENHDLSRAGRPKHRLRRLREIAGWLDSHLK